MKMVLYFFPITTAFSENNRAVQSRKRRVLAVFSERRVHCFLKTHQGLFDGFAIVDACSMPFSTVYKKELQNIPFLKQIFACVKAIALDRGDIRQGLAIIQQVTKEVKAGRNYMIFAEGTRSLSKNQLLDFKGGSFKSAMKAKCPIVPVALIDSYKVFDTGSTERTTVQVHFLDALRYEDYRGLSTVEVAELVKAAIEKAITEHDGGQ